MPSWEDFAAEAVKGRLLRELNGSIGAWFHDAQDDEPAIVGWGYGRKMRDGVATNEASVAIFVQEKLHSSLVARRGVVPPSLGGLTTDVVEIGRPRLLTGIEELPRPVPWGCQISHEDGDAGTLGCLAVGDGETYLLSNAHVLAPPGAKKGTRITQPGAAVDADDCWIAKLSRWIAVETTETTPLEHQNNLADAAIAVVRSSGAQPMGYVATAFAATTGLQLSSWRATKDVALKLPVAKVGAMTGRMDGQVAYLHASVKVEFGPGMALFSEQFLTTDIGAPGDSGSLVVCPDDGSAVGLLFGQSVSSGKTFSMVSPIQTIQDALGVRVADKQW